MQDCLFCKIINGDIPSYKVWEDENYLAFLTINPTAEGHTLVIPRKHSGYIFDLEDQELSNLILDSKKVSKILMRAFNPVSGKIGIMVVGLEVDHVHLHLIPLNSIKDISPENAHTATPEELTSALEKCQKLQ